ncbi:MAG: hypothetical protein HQ596_05235 [Candidatus Saganbacteria bacterium]|nr:hypothetical protein [Candidatus Saganbacteria bacterium]
MANAVLPLARNRTKKAGLTGVLPALRFQRDLARISKPRTSIAQLIALSNRFDHSCNKNHPIHSAIASELIARAKERRDVSDILDAITTQGFSFWTTLALLKKKNCPPLVLISFLYTKELLHPNIFKAVLVHPNPLPLSEVVDYFERVLLPATHSKDGEFSITSATMHIGGFKILSMSQAPLERIITYPQRRRTQKLIALILSHYLYLTAEVYEKISAAVKVAPPSSTIKGPKVARVVPDLWHERFLLIPREMEPAEAQALPIFPPPPKGVFVGFGIASLS